MHISFSPTRSDDRRTLSREGETLTLNGLAVDLAAVQEGVALTGEDLGCDWIIEARRDVGALPGLQRTSPASTSRSAWSMRPQCGSYIAASS